MWESLVPPDNFTFPIVNRAISSLGDHLKCGEMVHCVGGKMGFGQNLYFCNTLIEMYVKNNSIGSAYKVFEEMPERDLVSWTSIISGYVFVGDVISSYRIFREMRLENLEPNNVTLLIMFGACVVEKSLVQGRILHGYVIKKGLESNGSLQNSILTMYGKSGSSEDAEILFGKLLYKDVVSWNIMISTYSFKEDYSRVADVFAKMRPEVIPSVETLTLVISSFSKSGFLLEGKQLHAYVVKSGFRDTVLQTSIVDFYAKCGEVEASFQLFKEVPNKNYITWSAMMSGFVQNGYFKEAIEMYCDMEAADLKLGVDILRNLILSYTHLGALELGKVVHGIVVRNVSYSSDVNKVAMETSILSMYARCGSVISARQCFDQMVIKDVVAWSSIIEAYGNHGLGFEALELFNYMLDEGVKPNSITILSLLSACSHSGLVNEGFKIFDYMTTTLGIEPDLNHYTCMVDLLGRCGMLQEAWELIDKLVDDPDSRIWGALLSASRVHLNSKISACAAERLMELNHDTGHYHTLLSNVYASSQRWTNAETVRRVMHEKNLKKPPGWSCIEVRGKLHGFVARDGSHSRVREIYEMLGCLHRNLVEEFG